jgi:hypothetical protein
VGICVDRSAEQKALQLIASKSAHRVRLRFSFDAFGGRLDA